MNEEEWNQVRDFVRYHSEREVYAGYCYCLTEIRNLDTGRKIRTIKLVPDSDRASYDPTSLWSASDARRFLGLLPVTSLVKRRPAEMIFNLEAYSRIRIY